MKASVLGGTFFASIANIGAEDLLTTIILATIGAVVSFIVSILLRFVFKMITTRFKKQLSTSTSKRSKSQH